MNIHIQSLKVWLKSVVPWLKYNFLGVDNKNFKTYVICLYPTRNLYANFVAIREGTAEHYCVQFGGRPYLEINVFSRIFSIAKFFEWLGGSPTPKQ